MRRLTSKSRRHDTLKDAAILAFKRVIDPMLSLMLDVGATVPEINQIIRERAVRMGRERVISDTGKESRARIAIATGLPRSEIARILSARDILSTRRRGQHIVRRLLDAWHDDDKFLTVEGEPAVLPIFGARKSFEKLVSTYAKGTPVRAVLDELTRLDAIERLANQHIKMKSRFPIFTGFDVDAISILGERGRDLLDTLTNNIRRQSTPFFEATALVVDVDPETLAFVRREVSQQGASFINGVNSLLSRSRSSRSYSSPEQNKGQRAGVSIYYFQDPERTTDALVSASSMHRTNLRRKPYRPRSTNFAKSRSRMS